MLIFFIIFLQLKKIKSQTTHIVLLVAPWDVNGYKGELYSKWYFILVHIRFLDEFSSPQSEVFLVEWNSSFKIREVYKEKVGTNFVGSWCFNWQNKREQWKIKSDVIFGTKQKIFRVFTFLERDAWERFFSNKVCTF